MLEYRKNIIRKCVECTLSENCFECELSSSCIGIEDIITDCICEMNNKEHNEILIHCIEILNRRNNGSRFSS